MRSKGSLVKQRGIFKIPHKTFEIPYKTERRLLFGAIAAFVGLAGAVASAGIFAPTDPASAVTEKITVNLQQTGYFVRLLAAPTLSIKMDSISGTRVDAVSAGLKAQTNSPKGYAVYVSVDGDHTGLCRTDDTSYTQCINSLDTDKTNLEDNT